MSFRSPHEFENDLDALEAVEKATTRFVGHAVHDLLPIAAQQFQGIAVGTGVGDRANYLGEDLTRLALDRIGASRVIDGRLFGTTDYKLASYQFLPDFAVRQALFVDSKAEKNALNVARIQVTQTSLEVRQFRDSGPICVAGRVPPIWSSQDGHDYLPTTVFVKYHYRQSAEGLELRVVSVVALPHAFLQEIYNPTAADRIWNVGP
ncbi:MAG: SfiI family type II restriction endonuclease, partial [Gaiellaceae bacterium MAG52_C11]|nr:SfiI family type II restriction endonuclease [Candidatus Gaiellasilicea maunaloa]